MQRIFTFFLVALPVGFTAYADEFPEPVNTQAAGQHPPSPQEMPALFDLPEGFQVTLFAGEPDVQQPIAFDFDDRGRIWVAENYTYSAHGKVSSDLRDRIIILQDTNGDGEHDVRKVFWDKGRMLTGLTTGYGGLWILNDGTLSFIPDRNGDDVPDGEPVTMLNGWTKNAGHNFVSGLLWGPDGWLYGRHGITDTSLPGTPDTPEHERQPMNCGIWRFHPTRHEFEVVCNGTTNPWGLDYNEYGDLFMSNNVIGHLWHVIPGAHYERMFGQDFNPHLYELMEQCADHYHWDHTGRWSDSRDGKANDLGGGHSHCGLMIYYGDNFPQKYRGKAFMCNTHGRCVNVDRLERKGGSYVAKHEPNFLTVNTPWFRGVELKYGPRGCVYLSDWADNGECHDHDGVHRTSGRIYRISYGEPGAFRNGKSGPDVSTTTGNGISPEWHERRKVRILSEQAHDGGASVKHSIQDYLREQVTGNDTSEQHSENNDSQMCRTLWTLESTGGPSREIIVRLLEHDSENLQAIAVKLGIDNLCFNGASGDVSNGCAPLIQLCRATKSQRVLMALASGLQKLDLSARRHVGRELCLRTAAIDDKALQLMTWYGLADENDAEQLRSFAVAAKASPRLSRFVARKLVQRPDGHNVTGPLLAEATGDQLAAILQGMTEGLRGQVNPPTPVGWEKLNVALSNNESADIRRLHKELSVAYGDRQAMDSLRKLVRDRDGDHAARSRSIAVLAKAQDRESLNLFLSLLNDRAVYADIAKALAAFDDARIPKELLNRWNGLRHGSKEAAIDTLCSRKSYATELSKAIAGGRVDSRNLTAAQVRQLLAFNDPAITEVIESKWGVINESSEAKAAAVDNWKHKLTPETLAKADSANGAALFKKSCANCHRLYGEGGKIGPDLTGANRGNLDYVLGNVIDPSAVVPQQFTTSVIALTSGRIITGVVVAETSQIITVQTHKEQMVIAVSEIDERTRTSKSLMPDGLLDSLKEDQVRDLIAFVMKRR